MKALKARYPFHKVEVIGEKVAFAAAAAADFLRKERINSIQINLFNEFLSFCKESKPTISVEEGKPNDTLGDHSAIVFVEGLGRERAQASEKAPPRPIPASEC